MGEINEVVVRLLHKSLAEGTLTREEMLILEEWKNKSEANAQLLRQLSDNNFMLEEIRRFYALGTNETERWETVQESIGVNDNDKAPVVPIYRRRWRRIAAAVIAVIVISGLFTFLDHKQENQRFIQTGGQPLGPTNDVQPGKDGAILTLSDGSTIVLDSAVSGVIAKQGQANLVLSDGQLNYAGASAGTGAASVPMYNTISTPKGRQFRLVLPDGSFVWLNAATTLRYPAVFTGKSREVELSGEAYFEVAPNSSMPFSVKLRNGASVDVVGTHFNIMAYDNETDIHTTLVEGAVNVSNENMTRRLSPGQQAKMNANGSGEIRVVNGTDIEEAIAWKNGRFVFNAADMKAMMRQLERWYDIDVVFVGAVPTDRFSGKMPRSVTLSQVLTIMELSDVKFRLEGKTLSIVN